MVWCDGVVGRKMLWAVVFWWWAGVVRVGWGGVVGRW